MAQAHLLSTQQYLRWQDPFMYSQKYWLENVREPKTFLTLLLPCVCHQLWCHCGFPKHCQTAATWNKLGVTVIQTLQAWVKTFQRKKKKKKITYFTPYDRNCSQAGSKELEDSEVWRLKKKKKKKATNLIKTKKGMRRQIVENIGKIWEKWGENRGKYLPGSPQSTFLCRIQ